MVRGIRPALLLLAVCACRPAEVFPCQSNAQCVAGRYVGQCQPSGVCSFPDRDCPSGQRYGEFSGVQAGDCVQTDDGSTETGDATGDTMTGNAADSGNGSAVTTEPATSGPSTADPSATTGPPDAGEYGPCDRSCQGTCYVHGSTLFGACASACTSDDDCGLVMLEDLDYQTVCAAELGMKEQWCVIPCNDETECPQGSLCTVFLGVEIEQVCVWPL